MHVALHRTPEVSGIRETIRWPCQAPAGAPWVAQGAARTRASPGDRTFGIRFVVPDATGRGRTVARRRQRTTRISPLFTPFEAVRPACATSASGVRHDETIENRPNPRACPSTAAPWATQGAPAGAGSISLCERPASRGHLHRTKPCQRRWRSLQRYLCDKVQKQLTIIQVDVQGEFFLTLTGYRTILCDIVRVPRMCRFVKM